MRVRNKELRNRRHRKEQRIKELIKEAKAGTGDSKTKAAKPAAKKAAAPAADKPKRTTKKKSTTEESAAPAE